MRSVLILLVVVGFVAFATCLPVNKDDSKSEEIEEIDIVDQPNDVVLEEKRHKRLADTSSSSSEESNEVKKPAAGESKPLVAAAAETAAEGAGGAAKTGVEVVKAAPVPLRRKRCVSPQDFNSEESNEDNGANEEKSDPTSGSDEHQQKDPASNSDESGKKDDEDENEIVNEERSEA